MNNEPTIDQMNGVISEFMGYYHEGMDPDYSQYACNAFVADAKYHTSWDWLMPVVEKIPKLIHAELDLEMRREMSNRWKPIANELCNVNISNVHYCVHQFIQWYNQQKQNNESGFDYKSRDWEKEQIQPASEEAINRMKERWVSEGKRECPDCGLWFKSEGRCPECNPL